MKKWKIALALVVLAALLGAAMGEGADAAKTTWRGYALAATWVTADREAIGIPSLKDEGLAVLVQLTPEEGKIALGDVQDNREELTLMDADGDIWPATHCVYHNVQIDPVTMSPTIDPQQDNVELIFVLEGKDESALEGAQLVIAGAEPGSIPLDGVTREKPE